MKIKNIIVYGDAELIVKHMRKFYQDKHPRMISYRNYSWVLIENLFLTFNIHTVPRLENNQTHSLVVETSTSEPPDISNLKYEVEMKYRPSLTMSNIGRFLQMINILINFQKLLMNSLQLILTKRMIKIMNRLIKIVI